MKAKTKPNKQANQKTRTAETASTPKRKKTRKGGY